MTVKQSHAGRKLSPVFKAEGVDGRFAVTEEEIA